MSQPTNQVYELSLTSCHEGELSSLSDVFALYDNCIDSLKADLAKSSFLANLRLERETELSARIEEQAYLISAANTNKPVDDGVSSFERCQFETKIAKLEEQLSTAVDELSISKGALVIAGSEVEVLKVLVADKESLLEKGLSYLNSQVADLNERNLRLQDENIAAKALLEGQVKDNLLVGTSLANKEDQLIALSNQLVTLKAERKAALGEKREIEKKAATVTRENEVLNKEVVKFKTHRRESKAAIEAARNAMNDGTTRLNELSNELARERSERRYLTMMIDSLNHHDFYENKNGILALYSFAPERILTVDDANSDIDLTYPLGLWVGKKGVCCIVAVSKHSDDNGSRQLIIPQIDGLSIKGHKLICPTPTDCGLIADQLMKFNAIECNEAVGRCRAINSQIAKCTNHDENRILSNKRLMAICRHETQNGVSVLAKKTTSSTKRKPKAKSKTKRGK